MTGPRKRVRPHHTPVPDKLNLAGTCTCDRPCVLKDKDGSRCLKCGKAPKK